MLKRFTLNYFSEYQKDKIEQLVQDEMKYLFSNVITDSEILVRTELAMLIDQYTNFNGVFVFDRSTINFSQLPCLF